MKIDTSTSGIILKNSNGHSAFIPHALPPTIQWDTQLVSALSRADYLLGKLAREGSKLPDPYVLMRPFIVREAVLSSQIEGTQATISELFVHIAGADSAKTKSDVQEVSNYISSLTYGVDALAELPLSLRMIRELHYRLMQGVRGGHATPGQFRTVQNWIGTPGCTMDTAKFVPPPVEYLMPCLSSFESFLHNTQLPPLIHSALCHYQFEAIHPFLDGNGRVGRLLISLLLIDKKVLPAPLLYLSAYFHATRDEYYSMLFNVSAKGSWNQWLCYFLHGVALQAEDALLRATRMNDLLHDWKLQMSGNNLQTVRLIIDLCATNPYLTVPGVAEALGVAFTTAQRSVERLEAAGILTLVRDQKRDRLYCARALLAIIEEPAQL